MPSGMTAQRVPFVDPATGVITREWYNFLFSLFELTGSGQNSMSLTDLQLVPPVIQSGSSSTVTGKFRAYVSSTISLPSGSSGAVIFQTEQYDENGEYNTTTGTFTASAAGEWIVSVGVQFSGVTDASLAYIILYKNGAVYARLNSQRLGAGSTVQIQGSTPVTLAAGDTLTVRAFSSAAAPSVQTGSDTSFFCGLRVR